LTQPLRPESGADAAAGSHDDESLIERIDALLPQTQCTRCGFPGCLPYAAAIVQQGAAINRCPPGGRAGIEALAALLAREPLPLDAACGLEQESAVAWIDPQACIGCARCLPACPVDAIVGAPRFLHGVYEPECNGCELCIASCPVDCIHMRARTSGQPAPSAAENRHRHRRHGERLRREAAVHAALLGERKRAAQTPPAAPSAADPTAAVSPTAATPGAP
jgi:electron transport complex protein RnfB